jgi:hypothetical protein
MWPAVCSSSQYRDSVKDDRSHLCMYVDICSPIQNSVCSFKIGGSLCSPRGSKDIEQLSPKRVRGLRRWPQWGRPTGHFKPMAKCPGSLASFPCAGLTRDWRYRLFLHPLCSWSKIARVAVCMPFVFLTGGAPEPHRGHAATPGYLTRTHLEARSFPCAPIRIFATRPSLCLKLCFVQVPKLEPGPY